jgi:hypothetical protein
MPYRGHGLIRLVRSFPGGQSAHFPVEWYSLLTAADGSGPGPQRVVRGLLSPVPGRGQVRVDLIHLLPAAYLEPEHPMPPRQPWFQCLANSLLCRSRSIPPVRVAVR